MPQRHQDGTEDQIDALGRVSNALVLFNTRYVDAAVNQLIRAGPRTSGVRGPAAVPQRIKECRRVRRWSPEWWAIGVARSGLVVAVRIRAERLGHLSSLMQLRRPWLLSR
nr:hypothetical protein OG690_04455 [Streptomyces tubercidicus]